MFVACCGQLMVAAIINIFIEAHTYMSTYRFDAEIHLYNQLFDKHFLLFCIYHTELYIQVLLFYL